MKMRLEIDYKTNNNKHELLSSISSLMHIESTILMKYISYIIIDNKKYEKPKSDSKEIQKFYGFIEKNKYKITEIMSSDDRHYFLKDGKYHSYKDYCYYRPGVCKIYAINGKLLNKEQERTFKIHKKIKLIKDKIK
jgi:hypothetical protein